MSQDVGEHAFTAFPMEHPYCGLDKCAECFQVRAHPLHSGAPEPLGWDIEITSGDAIWRMLCQWRTSGHPGIARSTADNLVGYFAQSGYGERQGWVLRVVPIEAAP